MKLYKKKIRNIFLCFEPVLGSLVMKLKDIIPFNDN